MRLNLPAWTAHRVLHILLALTLIRGLFYAAITPPWQAPDETAHFEYGWLVAHLGRIPKRNDVPPSFEHGLIDSIYEWRWGQTVGRPLPDQVPERLKDLPKGNFVRQTRKVGRRFSLSYVWMALFIWPFRHQDLVVQLYAARFASVLLALGIVWLAWRIFQELLPDHHWLVIAMTTFVVFLPQHTFINASAGDGPLAELAACAVFYGWLRLFRGSGRALGVVAVVGGTLVGVWAKATVGFLLILDGLALALFLVTKLGRVTLRERWKYLVLGLLLITILAGVVLQTPTAERVRTRIGRWWLTPQINLANQRTTLGGTLLETFDSFWAVFGWMSVRVDDGWYIAVYALTILGIGGWLKPPPHNWSVPPYAKWILGAALFLSLAVWLAFALSSPVSLNLTQGRYLFPVTVPVAFLLVGGWARWVPDRWRRYFASGVVLILAILDGVAVSALWPDFYMGFFG